MAVFTSAAVAGVLGIASTSFLATVSTFALNAAVGVGLNIAVAQLTKVDQPQAGGVRGKLEAGGDVSRSFIMGTRATSGSLIYANTYGKSRKTPNAYLTQVIQLSDAPIKGVTSMWVNGSPVTVNSDDFSQAAGFPIEEYITDDGDHTMWVRFYDGTQTVADPFLVDTVSTAARPYESTRVGRGCAYVIVTSQVNSSFFSGFPSFRFEVAGMPLYDPSRDSTVGGLGSHRWSDRTTWGGDGDDLPAVQTYNLLRGITYDGAWLYGLQTLKAPALPAAHWIARINQCRALVTGPDGPETQYQTGIEVSVAAELGATIDAILKGAHGRLIEVGGIYKLQIGEPGAPVLSFTDADILSTEQQKGKPFASLANSINGITASYPEPTKAWNTQPAPPFYNADFEARDGKRRLIVDLPLGTVSRFAQVQRIMTAALAEARRERRHTITLPPWACLLEPGDIVEWTSARNSYSTKRFRVEGVADKANLDVMLDLIEVDPSDYDPPSGYVLPDVVPLGPVFPPVSILDGWEADPWEITDDAGVARRPAIKVKAADDLNDVLSVHIVARVKATGAVVFDSAAVAYASPYEWVISGNWCLPATIYQVKGIEVPYSGRKVEWSEWIDVLTPDIRLTVDELSQDIIDKLTELQEWIDDDLLDKVNQTISDLTDAVAQIDLEEQERIDGAIEASDRYRGLLDQIESIIDYVANADYAGYTAREEIRRTITARLEGSIAEFDERITTAVSNTAAISERLTTFNAQVGDLGARITLVDTARVDGQSALAQQISAITAGTDNQFDPFKFWGFDASVEGWTGNGTPTVTGGFLRPANHATDPYVVSPADLAVGAAAYPQVRGRIRKTGAPVWDGRAWWRQAADVTWDTARSATVIEPSFDANGIGLITFNMGWTGTIDRIRLDLSTVQDATNYYTIDWISIGSPSPGASRAELLSERTARISGDSANASDITALQASLTDANTGISGLAGAVTALDGRVTSIGGTVTAHSTALTGINAELMEKADVDVVAELQAEVEALGGGGIVSQGSAVTAIRNSLLPLASEVADQEFANFLSKMDGLKVTAEASNSLDTKITLMGDSLDIVSQAVTRVQAVIPGLASASALEVLISRVTATETTITAQASSINSINTSLPLKANTSDVNTALALKASASGLTALTGRVTQTENDISSQADAITAINVTLGTKASASALNSLTTLVTSSENGLATKASATSVTALSATLGDVTADYRQKAEVVAGPDGYVRVGQRLRYGTTGAFRTAATYFDVPANPALPVLYVVEAEQFAFVNGTSRLVPFRIAGDVVYIDQLKVNSSNIEAGAVTTYQTVSFPLGDLGSIDGSRNITVIIDHPDPAVTPGLVIRGDGWIAGTHLATGVGGVNTVTLVCRGTSFGGGSVVVAAGQFGQPTCFGVYEPPNGTTSSTMTLRATMRGNLTGGFAMFTVFKK